MDLSASVRFDHRFLAVEAADRVHCMLELIAPPARATGSRRPLHVALVIDRSDSMTGDPLRTAAACASHLARRMSPTDDLAIVTFDDEVRLERSLSAVGTEAPAIVGTLRRVRPGGTTNLSGGWLEGVNQLRGLPGGNGPRKVILLSDGLADRGITDPATLVRLAHDAADDGVGTTTIGIGEDRDEERLANLAEAGGGNACVAGTPQEAPAIFAREFAGLASIVAQNLSVELRPADEAVMGAVVHDDPSHPIGGGVQIPLGETYGGERRRVAFELSVPGLADRGVVTVAEAVVRYVTAGAQLAAHELTIPITIDLEQRSRRCP